jgi:hypothetical protein
VGNNVPVSRASIPQQCAEKERVEEGMVYSEDNKRVWAENFVFEAVFIIDRSRTTIRE